MLFIIAKSYKRNVHTLRAFCKNTQIVRLRQRRAHQDDNFAKLRHELLSVRKLIAKILVAVSRIKIKRTKEMPAKLRAFRKYAQIVRLRQRRIHQADNLVKLRQEFLSMFDLITEIFCAVSRLKIKQTREMPAKLRAFRKYAMIFSLILRLSLQTLLSNS